MGDIMHSRVTDATNLPDDLKKYLTTCGLSGRVMRRCTLDTRLYHDLGIYGDIAEAFMEVLADSYKVDLSSFLFYKYFPGEFQGHSWLQSLIINCIPWGKWVFKKNHTYPAMTLKMILDSIRSGKLE